MLQAIYKYISKYIRLKSTIRLFFIGFIKGSTTLLLNKGKRPIIQDFKGTSKSIPLLEEELRMISKDPEVKFY